MLDSLYCTECVSTAAMCGVLAYFVLGVGPKDAISIALLGVVGKVLAEWVIEAFMGSWLSGSPVVVSAQRQQYYAENEPDYANPKM